MPAMHDFCALEIAPCLYLLLFVPCLSVHCVCVIGMPSSGSAQVSSGSFPILQTDLRALSLWHHHTLSHRSICHITLKRSDSVFFFPPKPSNSWRAGTFYFQLSAWCQAYSGYLTNVHWHKLHSDWQAYRCTWKVSENQSCICCYTKFASWSLGAVLGKNG